MNDERHFSKMSRSSELFRTVPLATLGTIGICVIIYVLQLILDIELRQFTLCPRRVIYLHEYYRIITSTLFHGNLMHIGLNMMSTSAISSLLEKRRGSFRHLFCTLWAIILTSAVYIVVAFLGYHWLGHTDLMYQHALGFSGVIFYMSVLECNLSPNQSRSLFGFATVPSYLYPWVLLVALQFIMPNLSFMGHLAGILVGYLEMYGLLDFVHNSDSYLKDMESWSSLQRVVNRPNFVVSPANASGIHFRFESGSIFRSLLQGLLMIFKFVHDVLETILVCVFGRGRLANANVRILGSHRDWPNFGGSSSSAGNNTAAVGDLIEGIDEDEDWVGLPPMPAPDTVSRIV